MESSSRLAEGSGTGTVIEPLLAIEREDRTGVLEFRAQGIATRIYARAGEIIFAEGGTIGETLGRLLIRSGRLTEEQVASVIRRMTDALVDDEAMRFGDVLVVYGFMGNDDLDHVLTQQVKEKLIGCVHRGEGEWTFSPENPSVDESSSFVVRTRPMLVEAAIQLPERRLETILALSENRYPEIAAPGSVVAAEFELSKDEETLLRELDGMWSVELVLSKSPSPNTMAMMAALVLGGGVDLRKAPNSTSPPSESRPVPPEFRTLRRARSGIPDGTARLKKFPDLFGGVTESSSTIHVRLPQRRSSRGKLPTPSQDELRRAQEALERLKVDLDKRRPASSRKRWPDPREDRERRLMAESAFHQGRLYLRAEEVSRALPGLHRAFELCPNQREYELYVKWTQMLVNDDFKDDSARAVIQGLATTTVKENRECELGYAILGHCAMHDGKDDAALRFFLRASQLDPKLVDAARYARILSMRAAKPRPPPSLPDDRRAARGRLATPIDEIVPLHVQKPSERMLAAAPVQPFEPPPPPVHPPSEAAPDLSALSRTMAMPAAPAPPPLPRPPLPPPSSSKAVPPPPLSSGTPPPPSSKPLVLEPPPPPMRASGSPRPLENEIPPPPRMPSMDPVASVHVAGTAPVIGPPTPIDGIPTARRRRLKVIAVIAASLTLTAALFFFVGSRLLGSDAETAKADPSPASTATETKPASSFTAGLTTTETKPASSVLPGPAATQTKPAGSGPPDAVQTASVKPERAPTSKTGILRARRAVGHRVFVDGRSIGEGGHDLVAPCGPHRVRVGSSGHERTLTIPCGGTLEVE